jgi:hypothetical protein
VIAKPNAGSADAAHRSCVRQRTVGRREASYVVGRRHDSDAMVHETAKAYEQVADGLLAMCDKQVIAQAARVLGLYVGYYQRRYGPIGTDAFTARSGDSASPEQAADFAEGMRALAAALTLSAGVAQQQDDE